MSQVNVQICSIHYSDKLVKFMGGSRECKEWGQGVWSPLEKHKWLLISLEILVGTPLSGPHFGPIASWGRSLMTIKKKVVWGPPWQNFLDWPMKLIRAWLRYDDIIGPRCEKICLRGFANNKGADQPAQQRSLTSAFVILFLENFIRKLATSKISIF